MPLRREYCLQLDRYQIRPHSPAADHLVLRKPSLADVSLLADLMLDAYRGTIDYDGETYQQSLEEVQRFFGGEYGQPLFDASWLGLSDQELVTSCCVSYWEKRHAPLISYLMTRARWKNRGYGAWMLREAINSLQILGYERAYAFITEGNLPSEVIFASHGFSRL
jgi:RimJ/RimL family protein N-acetyltransferase